MTLITFAYIGILSLAVNYLFLSDSGHGEHPTLEIEPFNAAHEQNDYEVCFCFFKLLYCPSC